MKPTKDSRNAIALRFFGLMSGIYGMSAATVCIAAGLIFGALVLYALSVITISVSLRD